LSSERVAKYAAVTAGIARGGGLVAATAPSGRPCSRLPTTPTHVLSLAGFTYIQEAKTVEKPRPSIDNAASPYAALSPLAVPPRRPPAPRYSPAAGGGDSNLVAIVVLFAAIVTLLPSWLRSRGRQAKTSLRVVSPETSSTAATDVATSPLRALARACGSGGFTGAGVRERDFTAAAARGRAEDGGA
jgi:hypothetical protein